MADEQSKAQMLASAQSAQYAAEAELQALIAAVRLLPPGTPVPPDKVATVKDDLVKRGEAAQQAVEKYAQAIYANIFVRGLASADLRRQIDNAVSYSRNYTAKFTTAAKLFRDGTTGFFKVIGGSTSAPEAVAIQPDQFNQANVLFAYADLALIMSIMARASEDATQGGLVFSLLPDVVSEAIVAPIVTALIDVWNILLAFAKAGRDMLRFFAGAAGDIPRGAQKLWEWLPWIVGIAVLGPPLLRIVVKGRQEGTDAALTETAASIERGRADAAAAARRAGSAAVRAGKVAAAAYTGNPTLAVAGYTLPRSRRRR